MADTIESVAVKLCEQAATEQISLRLFGSCAIRIKSAGRSDILDRCARHPKDIDCVITRADLNSLRNLLSSNGWDENVELTAQSDGRRLEFRNQASSLTVDVSVDELRFAQTLDVRHTIALDNPTLPAADLLLSKLQIPELTTSDFIDIIALVHAFPPADGAGETIDLSRIIEITSRSWRWHKSVMVALHSTRQELEDPLCNLNATERDTIRSSLTLIENAILTARKSLRWRVRSALGERLPWRDEVEVSLPSQVAGVATSSSAPKKPKKKGYCDDYKQAIERYAANPAEFIQIQQPIVLILAGVVGLSILFAIYCGITDGYHGRMRLYPITCWEMIALGDTIILTFFYFWALRSEAKAGKFSFTSGTAFIGVWGTVNVILLLIAFGLLFYSDYLRSAAEQHNESTAQTVNGVPLILILYIVYSALLFVSFLIFSGLDFVFSRRAKSFTRTREYWCLVVFVDGPAAIAFLLVLLYFLTVLYKGRTPSTDIVSGAVVMQMLVADTLYLLVASNLPHSLLANHFSKDCDQ